MGEGTGNNSREVAGTGTQEPNRDAGRGPDLELANKACFLYLKQLPAEKAKLLRMVLSNCKIDDLNAYPVYKKPFDLIFKRVQFKEWLPGLDSN